MTVKKKDDLKGLVDWALKGLVTALGLFGCFYFQQTFGAFQTSITAHDAAWQVSIQAITSTMKEIQQHLEQTDKTLLEIKVSRETYMPKFLEMINRQEEMGRKQDLLAARVMTTEEVLARHKLH